MEPRERTRTLFKIRTVTTFLSLDASDFSSRRVDEKIAKAASVGRQVEKALTEQGYECQTVRLATNPFPQWLSDENPEDQLHRLDTILQAQGIEFCSLGPAETTSQLSRQCPKIVQASPRFSCSASLKAADSEMALAAAKCIQQIAHLGNNDDAASNNTIAGAPDHVRDGLGNFRFCVAANAQAHIPFFPVAKAASSSNNNKESGGRLLLFAIGLENGALAQHLLQETKSIQHIMDKFRLGMAQAIKPVQSICQQVAEELGAGYLGIDTSLNPSLESTGSVARALEMLDEVEQFGQPGTIAAAAAITECLQNLPDIKLSGYCGLMLPLCEDERLSELASSTDSSHLLGGSPLLRIADLLSISHVCGVGIDTVPLAGDCSEKELASLLLDVAGVAHRWDKSLSCRVLPVPGKHVGEWTTFDFAHLVNARILPLSQT